MNGSTLGTPRSGVTTSVESRSATAPLRRVLVALDASPSAALALELALGLSRQFGSELILCTALDHEREIAAASMPDVVYPNIAELIERYDALASSLLQEASEKASAAGARSSATFLEGRPADAIARYADSHDVDAIVMGTHGRRGLERIFLGSTAEGVLRSAVVPTFVVHDAANAAAETARVATTPTSVAFTRILVAVDTSDPADGAIAFALSLATQNESVLLFCSAIETTQLVDNAALYGCDPVAFVRNARLAALRQLEERTQFSVAPHGQLERIILEGSPTDSILEAAVELHADIIVCGTHGRRGLRRMLLGSVAEGIVRRSTVPVAVVPSRAAESES